MTEKRRYKIVGFRDDNVKIRVLLQPADPVQPKEDSMSDMLKNPIGFANKLMDKQMSQIINDSFSISRQEYENNIYMVGEYLLVTLEKLGKEGNINENEV